MPKKKLNTEVDETTNSTTPQIQAVITTEISPLELDLGRTDLNTLVDKVNQIIKKVNN